MSTEEKFPDHDPLKLRGKRIGFHPNENYRYTIDSFSYPSSFEVYDKELEENVMRIGYIVEYKVKFNFENYGRKIVTCKVPSIQAEGTQHHKESFKKQVIDFLENHAETMLAKCEYDRILDWESPNKNDPKKEDI